MSDQITVNYCDTEIVYDEKNDSWCFTLRGRERKTESLAKAKEAIDKPVKEDKPQFDPIRCYIFDWDRWMIGNVTSVASDPSWDEKTKCVWFVMEKDRSRSKRNSSQLFPVTDATTEAVKAFESLTKQMNDLKAKRDKVHRSMQCLTVT